MDYLTRNFLNVTSLNELYVEPKDDEILGSFLLEEKLITKMVTKQAGDNDKKKREKVSNLLKMLHIRMSHNAKILEFFYAV